MGPEMGNPHQANPIEAGAAAVSKEFSVRGRPPRPGRPAYDGGVPAGFRRRDAFGHAGDRFMNRRQWMQSGIGAAGSS